MRGARCTLLLSLLILANLCGAQEEFEGLGEAIHEGGNLLPLWGEIRQMRLRRGELTSAELGQLRLWAETLQAGLNPVAVIRSLEEQDETFSLSPAGRIAIASALAVGPQGTKITEKPIARPYEVHFIMNRLDTLVQTDRMSAEMLDELIDLIRKQLQDPNRFYRAMMTLLVQEHEIRVSNALGESTAIVVAEHTNWNRPVLHEIAIHRIQALKEFVADEDRINRVRELILLRDFRGWTALLRDLDQGAVHTHALACAPLWKQRPSSEILAEDAEFQEWHRKAETAHQQAIPKTRHLAAGFGLVGVALLLADYRSLSSHLTGAWTSAWNSQWGEVALRLGSLLTGEDWVAIRDSENQSQSISRALGGLLGAGGTAFLAGAKLASLLTLGVPGLVAYGGLTFGLPMVGYLVGSTTGLTVNQFFSANAQGASQIRSLFE